MKPQITELAQSLVEIQRAAELAIELIEMGLDRGTIINNLKGIETRAVKAIDDNLPPFTAVETFHGYKIYWHDNRTTDEKLGEWK